MLNLSLLAVAEFDADAFGFPFPDFDDAVEIRLFVKLTCFNFSFQDFVVAGIDIIIQGGMDALYFERREKAIIDPFYRRIKIDSPLPHPLHLHPKRKFLLHRNFHFQKTPNQPFTRIHMKGAKRIANSLT